MAISIVIRLAVIAALFVSIAAFIPRKLATNSLISTSRVAASDADAWFKRKGPWDSKGLDTLIDANKAWAARKKIENPKLFQEDLKQPHNPKILWIGCSDARVPANELINEPPGNIFVTRNIANNVISTDFNLMSVLQYAVDYLKVKHVVVCGHYECGGVKASLSTFDHQAPLENWIKNIRDVARMHEGTLSTYSDFNDKFRKMVELNAQEQALNILKTNIVQQRRLETARMMASGDPDVKFVEPQVHAFTYDPLTGVLNKLPIEFGKKVEDLAPYSVIEWW
jgi:carbonic anhydrase